MMAEELAEQNEWEESVKVFNRVLEINKQNKQWSQQWEEQLNNQSNNRKSKFNLRSSRSNLDHLHEELPNSSKNSSNVNTGNGSSSSEFMAEDVVSFPRSLQLTINFFI